MITGPKFVRSWLATVCFRHQACELLAVPFTGALTQVV